MLLTTWSPISGALAKKNTGVVVLGGAIISGDRTIVMGDEIVSSFPRNNYINSGNSSGRYTQSGVVGGTLAQDTRDTTIVNLSQHNTLGGVAINPKVSMASPTADTYRTPALVVSGSVILTPSGWSYVTGLPIVPQVVTGETYSSSATDAGAASGPGLWVENQGNIIPISGNNPTRN